MAARHDVDLAFYTVVHLETTTSPTYDGLSSSAAAIISHEKRPSSRVSELQCALMRPPSSDSVFATGIRFINMTRVRAKEYGLVLALGASALGRSVARDWKSRLP